MLFSRVAAFFVGAVAFAMPVVAAPQPVAEIEKRAVGITDLTNILNELTANVQPLLPQISKGSCRLTLFSSRRSPCNV